MSCWETVQSYAFRSLGYGERLLPRDGFTLCEQVTLIGSGMIWNVYFGIVALLSGFFLATAVGVGKASGNMWIRKPSEWFIFLFRGSPLFIQFFFGYFLFLSLKNVDGTGTVWVLHTLLPDAIVPAAAIEWFFANVIAPTFQPFSAAWLGALVVLFLNTAAYTGEIFYGALQSVPRGDVEAADAYGLSGWPRFKRIIWPTTLRLAWPAYTNEAIFLFHATTLVFFSGFPAYQQRGDALYYASYFADKTFNPFVPYPILAGYFILLTLVVIGFFGLINKRLNRHLPQDARAKIRLRPNLIR